MRGYCPRCKEYRSDSGEDAWGFTSDKYGFRCEKCGALIDLLDGDDME
jgi:phage FluMu protein Com